MTQTRFSMYIWYSLIKYGYLYEHILLSICAWLFSLNLSLWYARLGPTFSQVHLLTCSFLSITTQRVTITSLVLQYLHAKFFNTPRRTSRKDPGDTEIPRSFFSLFINNKFLLQPLHLLWTISHIRLNYHVPSPDDSKI